MIYYRYRLDNGTYWGWTDLVDDDAECGYTTVAVPEYDVFSAIPVWHDGAWRLHDYSTGTLGAAL